MFERSRSAQMAETQRRSGSKAEQCPPLAPLPIVLTKRTPTGHGPQTQPQYGRRAGGFAGRSSEATATTGAAAASGTAAAVVSQKTTLIVNESVAAEAVVIPLSGHGDRTRMCPKENHRRV